MKRYFVSTVALVALSLMVLSGCSNAESEGNDSPSKLVRLAVHDSFVLSESLIQEFEKESGFELEIVKLGDAGSLVSSAILSAGTPTADVLFGIDNTLLQRALDANLFEAYTSSNSSSLAASLSGGAAVTAIDYGDVCINIDDAYFSQRGIDPPQQLADLILPDYRGLLVVQDPAASSPGLAFLLATIDTFGSDWPSYWEKLLANETKVAGSWSDAYYTDFTKGGGDGKYPLVVSYATSPPAEIVYAEEPKPTTVSTSVMTSGCYRQVEYAGVLRGTQNPIGAQAVIDWLTSKQVQEDIPLSMFVFPARVDAALPEVFTKFAGKVTNPSAIEPSVIRDSLSEWLTTWDELKRP